MATDPLARNDTQSQQHVHKRGDWRPCPWLMPDPIVPTKPAAVLLYAWADAVQHAESLEVFVRQHPGVFPGLSCAEPFIGSVVTR